MPDAVHMGLLTCEDGKWITDQAPYTGDNVCFPKGELILRTCFLVDWILAHRIRTSEILP